MGLLNLLLTEKADMDAPTLPVAQRIGKTIIEANSDRRSAILTLIEN